MRFFLFLAAFFYAGFSYSTPTDSLWINITFPVTGDTFAVDYLRVSGNTNPLARVFVNDSSVKVYPHGAFVSRVKLKPFMNKVDVRVEKDGIVKDNNIFVFRDPPLESYPKVPTRFDFRMMQPENDVWIMPGDYLTCRVKASPQADVFFSINQVIKRAQMVEIKENNLEGIYVGQIKIPNGDYDQPLKILYEMRGIDGRKVKAENSGKIYIMQQKIPVIGMTNSETMLHSISEGYDPVGRIPDSVKVHIVGKSSERIKIKLGENTVFVDVNDISLLPLGTPLPETNVSAPYIQVKPREYQLIMNVDEYVPFLLDKKDNTVVLTLFGGKVASHWITYPNYDTGIEHISISNKSPDITVVKVTLPQEPAWGYSAQYDNGKLVLKIRRPFQGTSQDINSLKGLTIAIDPGHGGEYTGAISPTGLLEKNVNLDWAKYLELFCENAGARVILTRYSDEHVSLLDRMNIARNESADIFISLHNNATSPGGNPLRARGTSVYFSLPQNMDLAWNVYPYLVKLGLIPYGRVQNSYFLTTFPDMPVLLVEGAFLTSPDDEQLFLNERFLYNLAQAVFNGIMDFVFSQAAKK